MPLSLSPHSLSLSLIALWIANLEPHALAARFGVENLSVPLNIKTRRIIVSCKQTYAEQKLALFGSPVTQIWPQIVCDELTRRFERRCLLSFASVMR